MPISEPWVRTNGQLQSLHNFQQKFGSNCSFCLKCLKTQKNLNPLQRPTHTLTSLWINTQNRSKNYVWIYHGMHWTLRYRHKLSITLKSKNLATCGFQKIPDTPTKTHWSRAQFQKGQRTPCKTTYAFPHLPLGSRVLATNLLPLPGPALKPTAQNSS